MTDKCVSAGRTDTHRRPESVGQQSLDRRRTADIACADCQDGKCVFWFLQNDQSSGYVTVLNPNRNGDRFGSAITGLLSHSVRLIRKVAGSHYLVQQSMKCAE